MTTKLPSPIPQIPVGNLDRAIGFYLSRQGFSLYWKCEDSIAGVSRRPRHPKASIRQTTPTMSPLFRFPGAMKRDPAVDAWLRYQSGELGDIAARWFAILRRCGDDVCEVLHDGHPTACVGEAAFAYVNVFTAHVNVGFFRGSELSDPEALLEGTGKFMRHVKLKPGRDVHSAALQALIAEALSDMRARVKKEAVAGRSESR